MVLRATRYLGAVALLALGGVHLQQYLDAGYRLIPTVGTLFLLNAIASAVVATALLAPTRLLFGDRHADLAVGVLAIAGTAIAAGALIALFVSETGSLFGFTEFGYDAPVIIAIVSEVATVVLLAPLAAISIARVGQPAPHASA
jgi:hypothetical protein